MRVPVPYRRHTRSGRLGFDYQEARAIVWPELSDDDEPNPAGDQTMSTMTDDEKMAFIKPNPNLHVGTEAELHASGIILADALRRIAFEIEGDLVAVQAGEALKSFWKFLDAWLWCACRSKWNWKACVELACDIEAPGQARTDPLSATSTGADA